MRSEPEIKLFTTKEKIQAHMQRRVDAHVASGAPAEVLALLDRENQGGPCPRCSKPWAREEVKSAHADFWYFVPDCNCYPRCACGEWIYEDFVMVGIMRCAVCEARLQVGQRGNGG